MGLGQSGANLKAAGQHAAKLGARYLIVSARPLATAGNPTEGDLRAKARKLNQPV